MEQGEMESWRSGRESPPVAGVTVPIVGLVSRSKGRPKTAGNLVELGLIVFGAFPVTILMLALIAAFTLG